jgi:predicted nuclease of predicted toxin-antitoxin system
VRLLLDAHVSARGVGLHLGRKGHDVLALTDDPAYEGLDDEGVLTLATAEGRILVTHNVADFPPILREWAAESRSHSGVILVHVIDHAEFGLLIDGLHKLLAERPAQPDWIAVSEVLSRSRFD